MIVLENKESFCLEQKIVSQRVADCHGIKMSRRQVAMETGCYGDRFMWRQVALQTCYYGNRLSLTQVVMETGCHGDR